LFILINSQVYSFFFMVVFFHDEIKIRIILSDKEYGKRAALVKYLIY